MPRKPRTPPPPTEPPAAPPPQHNYRLPDGSIVAINDDATRGEATISYTLEGGEVVNAERVDEPVAPTNVVPCMPCSGTGEIIDADDPTVTRDCDNCGGAGVIPELPDPDVNPVQAAADLAAAEPSPAEPAPGPTPPAPAPDHIPDFLAKLRDEVIRAESEYDDAAEEAKRTKKAWEEVRERFERAFDAEIRKSTREPGLPFDGVHMSDTPQSATPAAAEPEKEPTTVHEFPRAVPDPPEPTAEDIAKDPAAPPAAAEPTTDPAPPTDEPDPTVH